MKERKIKAVIFDLGDTLIDSKGGDLSKFIKKQNLDIEFEFLLKTYSKIFGKKCWKNLDEGITKFAKKLNCDKDKSFIENFKEVWLNQKHNFKKFPETETVLKKLNDFNYKTAIISNWNQSCMDVVDHHGLSNYFHHIVISAHEGIKKPDPRIFRKVLKHFKVKPKEALMVGDSHNNDYLAAKKLGMHALLLERREKKHGHSIKNLRQVISYLKKVNGKL